MSEPIALYATPEQLAAFLLALDQLGVAVRDQVAALAEAGLSSEVAPLAEHWLSAAAERVQLRQRHVTPTELRRLTEQGCDLAEALTMEAAAIRREASPR